MIIDEEQRFGVAQKERLKQFRKNIHVLAMSATPVPRTLQLSIAGVRDLSLIETPPKDRMAIETQIVPYNKELIKEAIEAELERGGQVYYVYNQVDSIERMSSIAARADSRPAHHHRPRADGRARARRAACTPSPRTSTTCWWPRPSSRTGSTSPTSTP